MLGRIAIGVVVGTGVDHFVPGHEELVGPEGGHGATELGGAPRVRCPTSRQQQIGREKRLNGHVAASSLGRQGYDADRGDRRTDGHSFKVLVHGFTLCVFRRHFTTGVSDRDGPHERPPPETRIQMNMAPGGGRVDGDVGAVQVPRQ